MSEQKKSTISIEVELDENQTPENILWKAKDDPAQKGIQEAKAMFLAFFDRNTLETIRIDLWTKDLQIQEMDRLVYQSLRSITDTYFKATKNQELTGAMQQFSNYFAEQTGIISKPKDQ